jgi:hypothetical protein
MKDILSVREYDPHKRWRDSQAGVVRAWKWAARIGGGLLGTLIVGREVLRVLTFPFSMSHLLFLILFAMQALFIVLWVWVTENELRLLAQWLDPLDYEPPSGQTQMIESVGIAIFLVAMLVATRNPLWYGAMFLLYSTLDFIGVRYFNAELRKAINGSEAHLKAVENSMNSDIASTYRSALDVIEWYWLKLRRPRALRQAFLLTFGVVGFLLAIGWKTYANDRLKSAAYLVFIFNLFVSEVVIWRWREVRDGSLHNLLLRLPKTAA